MTVCVHVCIQVTAAQYFKDFVNSFISLFVLLTSAKYAALYFYFGCVCICGFCFTG